MSNDSNKPSIGKRGGEFFILAIYLFGDFWEFWDVNHLLCLFLAGLGIFSLIWYDDALSPRQLAVVAAALVTVAIGTAWLAPPIPAPEPWRGWLQPENETNSNTDPVIIAGTNILSYTGKADAPFNVIRIGNCPTLIMRRSSEGLKISAAIYSSDMEHLGDIEDNGYNIIRKQSITIEHTGDLSALIVHDALAREILHVRYENTNRIKIRGTFFCPSTPKDWLRITEDAVTTFPQQQIFSGDRMIAGQGIFCVKCDAH